MTAWASDSKKIYPLVALTATKVKIESTYDKELLS